jgi:segregation and condensation protein B
MDIKTKQLLAVLYGASKPLSLKALSELLDTSEEGIAELIENTRASLEGGAFIIVEQDGHYLLGTHPDTVEVVEKLFTNESQSELSRASAETLAVILYYPSPTKADIEYIRGVNATYSLRSLMMRGLITNVQKAGIRGGVYVPTIEVLQHYGVASVEELPEYKETREKIESIINTKESE